MGIVIDDAIVVVENVERVMEEEPETTPTEATKKAMAQITAPIIAISLVLLSVFVPIAFIPGVSGTLFRQFAVTISVAMVISALNALTLSPALCGVFLRHTGPRRGIMGRVLGGIDWVRDRYASGVRRLLRMAVSLVLVLVFAGGIFGVSRITPTARVWRWIPDPASQCPAVQPATDHRALDLRRIRVSARCAGRTGPGRARQRPERPDRRGQPRSPADAGILDLLPRPIPRSISTSTAPRRRRLD